MKNLILLLLFGTFFTISHALETSNVSVTLSDRMIWSDGTEKLMTSGQSKKISYFENYLDGRFSFGQKITTGIRFSTLQPSYWGERTQGLSAIDKRWLRYSKDKFNITIGNTYTVWGRGLVLALIEDFEQGLDSGVDGVLINYNLENLQIEAIRGRSELDPAGYTKPNDIQGASIQYNVKNTKISTSFLQTLPENYPDIRTSGVSFQTQQYLQNVGTLSFFWEGSWQAEANTNNVNRGWFSTISFARKGFSLQVDYKDYQFRLVHGNLLPYQSPPVVLKELISKTMSSHPHNPKYDDEIGWQTEIHYKPLKTIEIIGYTGHSSSHHESPIPSLEQKDSPFIEHMAEVQWKITKKQNIRLQYATRQETLWNSYFQVPSIWNQRKGFLVGVQTGLTKRFNVELISEQMFTKDKIKKQSIRDGYYNATISLSGKGSIAFLMETTNDKNEMSGPNWFALEANYQVQPGVQLQLFTGKQRGGIVCSSGRCRPVNPFQGVRVSVEINF
ncbi:MAG: DUF6029 family protein [bacterium]|nr:DUF6029 family protein [bacterium]